MLPEGLNNPLYIGACDMIKITVGHTNDLSSAKTTLTSNDVVQVIAAAKVKSIDSPVGRIEGACTCS